MLLALYRHSFSWEICSSPMTIQMFRLFLLEQKWLFQEKKNLGTTSVKLFQENLLLGEQMSVYSDSENSAVHSYDMRADLNDTNKRS